MRSPSARLCQPCLWNGIGNQILLGRHLRTLENREVSVEGSGTRTRRSNRWRHAQRSPQILEETRHAGPEDVLNGKISLRPKANANRRRPTASSNAPLCTPRLPLAAHRRGSPLLRYFDFPLRDHLPLLQPVRFVPSILPSTPFTIIHSFRHNGLDRASLHGNPAEGDLFHRFRWDDHRRR